MRAVDVCLPPRGTDTAALLSSHLLSETTTTCFHNNNLFFTAISDYIELAQRKRRVLKSTQTKRKAAHNTSLDYDDQIMVSSV